MNQSDRPQFNEEVISDPVRVAARLRQLHKSLNMGWFIESLRAGLAKRANTTILHGKIFPGIVMHFESMARFREISIPKGWKAGSIMNFETAISPDESIAIAIAGGDVYTGIADRTPTTRNNRGLVTRQAVRQNRQAELAFDAEAAAKNRKVFSGDAPADEYQITWILLHSLVEDYLRCEFSCPLEIDESGKINKWKQRLILTTIPPDFDAIRRPEDQPIEPIVDIRRRA